MVGWHHQLNGHGFGWTLGVGDGQGGLVCCDSWGHKELDMTEWLNWNELIDLIQKYSEDLWFWDEANFLQNFSALPFLRISSKDSQKWFVGQNLNYTKDSSLVGDLTGFTINTDIHELRHVRWPSTITITSVQQKSVFLL